MEEIWKDIYEYDGVNYQGKYQISNYGNVRSKDRIVNSSRGQTYFRSGKSIKPFYSCKYLRIRLYDEKPLIQSQFIELLLHILFKTQIQKFSKR